MRGETRSGEIVWLAVAVLFIAGGIYLFRQPARIETYQTKTLIRLNQGVPASTLLLQAFQANKTQQYSGITNAEVFADGHWYNSSARIAKAPDHLTLDFFSGANTGLECGYSGNWMWRKKSNAPLIPYAKLNEGLARESETRLQLLLHNYEVTWKGTANIDQRPADLLEITPRHAMIDASGPAKRIWIDRATKLPLRIETFNYQMTPVMRSTLSDLQLTDQPATSFVTDESIQAALAQTPWTAYQMGNNYDEAGRIAGVFPPIPTYVPSGFMREEVGLHRCSPAAATPDDSCYASLSRYSDGMNSLTLFALNPNCANQLHLDQTPQSQEQNLDEQIYVFGPGAVSTRTTKAGTIVAVADFSPAELRRVLNSIEIRTYSMTSELNGNANAASD